MTNMNPKRVNWLFATIIMAEAALIVASAFFVRIGALPVVPNILLSQMTLFVPAIFFVIFSKEKFRELIPLRLPKISSLILLVVISFLFMPLLTVMNAISLLFVENESQAIMGLLQGTPYWLVFLFVGILGPLSEEFVFRGVIYHGYRKSGRIIMSGFLSAFLFGVMHLNFNQMSYAIVMGLLGVMMIEATGSFWASFIFHMCVNSSSVIMSYGILTGGAQVQSFDEAATQNGMSSQEQLLVMIAIYMVIAAITTTIGMCLLYKVAEIEKQIEKIQALMDLQKEKNHCKMITLPFVISVGLCIAFMLLEIWLSKK